eukprot:scaffold73064_cov40-Phaeocystis_antarctica.AAC.1
MPEAAARAGVRCGDVVSDGAIALAQPHARLRVDTSGRVGSFLPPPPAPNLRAESTLTTTPSTRSTPKPPLSTAGRRGRRAGARRFCCRRSLGAYALGVLLFLPASILVLLTAEFGFDTRTWYTRLRRPGSREDEPRRDSYVASELREAVKELQAAKEQLGSTVALAAAPAHGSSLGAIAASSTVAAPVRTIGSAPSGQPVVAQPEAAAATRSAARSRSGGKPMGAGRSGGISEGGRSAISEDLIRAALDDVGLEGILGELSESTHLRRESSEGKELLRQQRASAALRQHEQLSEEERPSSAPAPPQGAPGDTGQLGTPRVRPSALGAKPLPLVLEPAASKVANSTAFDRPGAPSGRGRSPSGDPPPADRCSGWPAGCNPCARSVPGGRRGGG